jgi:Tfp pilus assembly protein PilF
MAIALLVTCDVALAQNVPTLNQVVETAQSGRVKEAQQMLQQVLIAHPKSAKAYLLQAELALSQGQSELARESLAKAESFEPGLPFAKPEAVQRLKSRIETIAANENSTQLKNPTGVVSAFRSIWCKSIDKSANSPFDFKDIKIGDLCQVPDELIVAIEAKLRETCPKDLQGCTTWMTQPKVRLKSGIGSLTIKNIKVGERAFFAMAISLDPYNEKAYLASFSALLCAADPTNSLNAGNPFRKALENKYGSPAEITTEYDEAKSQIDALEAQTNLARKQTITVQEAKSVREANSLLPSLKALAAVASKDAVLYLKWDYENGNKLRPVGIVLVSKADPIGIADLGGCPVKKSIEGRLRDYGFAIGFTGSKTLVSIFNAVDEKDAEIAKQKIQTAPAPKF